MDFPKIDVIRTCLAEAFPEKELDEKEDFTLHARSFLIQAEPHPYRLKVSRDFADDTDAEELAKLLRDHQVGDQMKTPDIDHVFFGSDGPELRR